MVVEPPAVVTVVAVAAAMAVVNEEVCPATEDASNGDVDELRVEACGNKRNERENGTNAAGIEMGTDV